MTKLPGYPIPSPDHPMSDTYYREQSARRSRMILLGAIAALVTGCLALGTYSIFRDTCTGSFERSPQSIVESYVSAVSRGDGNNAAACWHHLSYLDSDTGCSEICISRLLGTPFELQNVQLGEPTVNDENRARIQAQVTAVCPDGSQNTGELTLDSVASSVPWRHWKIVHSTIGGPLSDPWCN